MPLILPTPERLNRLRRINRLLTEFKASQNPKEAAEAAALAVQEPSFREQLQKQYKGKAPRLDTVAKLETFLFSFLYHFLYNRDYVSAAIILWSDESFTPQPKCVQDIWETLFQQRMISILGGGGLGKTYSASAWLLLDWVLDPQWTRIQVSSNTADHLIGNLFADITRLYQTASLPLPGVADSESISLDKKTGMGIFILTIPGGPLSKGKIRGTHTKPRPPHPLFGTRSRVRALIDEAQEVAPNIFDEIPNRFSTVGKGDIEHIKFIVAANPKFKYSKFGQICKPFGGWEAVSRQTKSWPSEEGWFVVSIDATQHENVKQQREVFQRFVTYEGVQGWLRRCHNDPEHPDMYTFVYGKFPPEGSRHAIIRPVDIEHSEREWVFDGPTTAIGFSDHAFTGDHPTFGSGRAGRAIAYVDRVGTRHELSAPAWKLQVDFVKILERGDTQDMADQNMENCRMLAIKPHHYGDDRTGVGQGVHDTIRRQWKAKVGSFKADDAPDMPGFEGDEDFAPIYGIHYGQAGTETKVAEEDTENCKALYDGIHSEVWYAASRLFEYDAIGIGRGVDPKCVEELTARQGGRVAGRKSKLGVESKDEYKARTRSHSPDRADTFLGIVHMARMTIQHLLPKARDTKGTPAPIDATPMGEIQEFGGAEISEFGPAAAMETMRD